MSDKVILWILGALSSGKTTQNKLLLEKLGTAPLKYHEGEEAGIPYFFTTYGDICSLGKIDGTQCCGLDRVSSRLKNEGVKLSIEKALQVCSIVIVESIMSASTWPALFQGFDVHKMMFRLNTTFEENVRRLKWRQWQDKSEKSSDRGDFLQHKLTDANYEFIRKTRMQYENIFEKFKDQFEVARVVECDDKSPLQIHREILRLMA